MLAVVLVLQLEVASSQLSRFRDGVFFVDLALAQVAALGSTVAFLYGFDQSDSVTYYVSLAFAAIALAAAFVARNQDVAIDDGATDAGMAADALESSPSFRAALADVELALTPHLGWSVSERLNNPDADGLRNTDTAQPLLFAIQVALVLALREQGVTPDACMGHSVGEVAAALLRTTLAEGREVAQDAHAGGRDRLGV